MTQELTRQELRNGRLVVRHNSHIRSEWLPIGVGRVTAAKIVELVNERLATVIEDEVYKDYRHPDRLTVTSPGGWKAGHPDGASTVKVRGCDDFRSVARTHARWVCQNLGIDWNGGSR